MGTYRRLTYNDRLKLEALYNLGMPVVKIAEELSKLGIKIFLRNFTFRLDKLPFLDVQF